MFIGEDPEYFTIDQLKETGLWPYTFLSAYGMLPYLNRMKADTIVGAEVGVLKGENVVTLLDECTKISKIYGVDHYECHTDYDIMRSSDDMEKYEKVAERNLAPYSDRYELIKADSVVAAKKLDPNSLDFVLIDADHSTPGIMRDLEAYYPLVKSGGYIFIHDCNAKSVMDGIKKFREENKIRLPIQTSKNFVCYWVKS
jgi:hypothetical protein